MRVADHHRARARPHRPLVHQASHGLGEEHADEVVSGEDERLLECTGRDDDALRPNPEEDLARVDRYETALVDPR